MWRERKRHYSDFIGKFIYKWFLGDPQPTTTTEADDAKEESEYILMWAGRVHWSVKFKLENIDFIKRFRFCFHWNILEHAVSAFLSENSFWFSKLTFPFNLLWLFFVFYISDWISKISKIYSHFPPRWSLLCFSSISNCMTGNLF